MDPMQRIRDQKGELKKRFGLDRIGLFGSAVRDEMRPDSDIDVLVEFQPGQATFDHYMDLKFYLEDTLERDVDLVTIDSIKPPNRALKVKLLSYSGDNSTDYS